MDKHKQKEIIAGLLSGVLSGAVFLILLFVFHWNFLVDMILADCAFFGLSLLLKPKRKIGRISIDTLHEGEELSRQLEEARRDLRCIEQSMQQIQKPEVRQEVLRLKQTSQNIIAYLEKPVYYCYGTFQSAEGA